VGCASIEEERGGNINESVDNTDLIINLKKNKDKRKM
jgi:hypothetical protein